MITMAQRIEALRVEKGLSRPQLSAALGTTVTESTHSELCAAIGLGRHIGEKIAENSLIRDNTA